MKKSKLFDLLKPLSTKEIEKFRSYVYSPFFNKNQKLRRLCDYILVFAPDFADQQLEKPNVYKHIFGDQKYQVLQINNIISDLLQLLYDFLAQLQFQQKPQIQKYLLLEELMNRDAPFHVERKMLAGSKHCNKNLKSEIMNISIINLCFMKNWINP